MSRRANLKSIAAASLLAAAAMPNVWAQDSACSPAGPRVNSGSQVCNCPKCQAKRAEEPHRWSDEWHARNNPVGAIGSEQHFHSGQAWPPYPRPVKNAECTSQFHAAHYWPHPYNCWDKGYVKQITATQVANGWVQATTLYGYHFDPQSHTLNSSGELYLNWILFQTPTPHRMVFIQSSVDEQQNLSRVSSVESAIASRGIQGSVPISLRTTGTLARPAQEVDGVRRAEMGSLPQPRIPIVTSAGGAGGGGGGGPAPSGP